MVMTEQKRDLWAIAGNLTDDAHQLLLEAAAGLIRGINGKLHRQLELNVAPQPCVQEDYKLIAKLDYLGLINLAKDSKWPAHELQYVATGDGFACLSMRRSLDSVGVVFGEEGSANG
jgi:hypothetical protein